MEPDIPNNCILLIKEVIEVEHTKIGIFFCDGDSYYKKIIHTDNGVLLVSNNRAYQPQKIVGLEHLGQL